jgi:hypothetical protein
VMTMIPEPIRNFERACIRILPGEFRGTIGVYHIGTATWES